MCKYERAKMFENILKMVSVFVQGIFDTHRVLNIKIINNL